MTVLDAQAIIAYLLDEAAAGDVEQLLTDDATECVVSAVNCAEVIDVLVRGYGRPLPDVEEKLDWLAAGGVQAVSVDAEIGRLAGRIRADDYHRTRSPLSLADCIALATAVARRDSLATADAMLAGAAERRGVNVVHLPSSGG